MTLSHKLPVWLLAGLLAIGSVACSGTETTDDASDAADASDATDPADSTDAADPSDTAGCTQTGFTVAQSSATNGNGNWGIAASDADGSTIIQINSLQDWSGPTTTGSFDLGGINYKDCGLCLMIYADCQQGQNCATTYYADVGTVNVTALDLQVDGTVELEL